MYYSHIHLRERKLKSCPKDMYYFSFDKLNLDRIDNIKLVFDGVPQYAELNLYATIMKNDNTAKLIYL